MKKKVGLALGAGSTKGFAHIGVLQVLEEHHIPIDLIAGSSIGAIVASIYAAGTDLHLLEKFVLQMNIRDYLDIGKLGAGGLIRGDKLEALIRLLTHRKRFEETNIPLYCMTVDAAAGELIAMHEGEISRAVRASMSIPGIFVPVSIDGRVYVDGGVIERLPCGVLRENGADVVLAVDVGYCGGEYDVQGMNAYDMINRSIDIMQWEITKLHKVDADVLLVPQVLFVRGHFATKESRAVIEEGRRVAEEAMPEILALLEQQGIPLKE